MNKRCDGDFERLLGELLPEAAPRLAPDRVHEMRRRVTDAVRGDDSVSRWRLIARRSVIGFVAGSSLLGSVSVAAAMSRPGEPAYALKQVVEVVREAVSPERVVVKQPPAPKKAQPRQDTGREAPPVTRSAHQRAVEERKQQGAASSVAPGKAKGRKAGPPEGVAKGWHKTGKPSDRRHGSPRTRGNGPDGRAKNKGNGRNPVR